MPEMALGGEREMGAAKAAEIMKDAGSRDGPLNPPEGDLKTLRELFVFLEGANEP